MAERRILALGNPEAVAAVRERIMADAGPGVEGRLRLLAEAVSARIFVDAGDLTFTDGAGERVSLVPHPPVMRYAGLLAAGEVIGAGKITMVAGQDDMSAAEIAAFVANQGDE